MQQNYFDFDGTRPEPTVRETKPENHKRVYPVHSRTDDPISSYQAGAETYRSGARTRQSIEMLDLVCQHPGQTSAELAAISERLDRYQTARVLPALADKGLVVRGDFRTCNVTKRKCLIWYPTPCGQQQRNARAAG